MTQGYKFTSKNELDGAVDLWTSTYPWRNDEALETYGEINTWDVSAISDFSNTFQWATI